MWFIRFIQSSIGRKLIMATTGLFLFIFLCTHVAGNATIFMSSEIFQSYADELHSHPLIVLVFSSVLFLILLFHACMGVFLFFKNKEEGFSRYAVNKRTSKNSIASKTMVYTGAVILLFIIVHVAAFTFREGSIPISATVQILLGSFWYGVFYIFSFAVLGLHLSHGFWSMLQTFGVNHPRYNPLIQNLTFIIPVFFFIFFTGIPLYFMTGLGSNY